MLTKPYPNKLPTSINKLAPKAKNSNENTINLRHSCACQLFATLASTLSLLGYVTAISWGIVATKQLSNSVINEQLVTQTEVGWVLIAMYAGAGLGAMISGTLGNHLGARKSKLLALPFILTSYLVIYFSNSLKLIILARFVKGISSAIPMSLYSAYIGGISSAEHRGKFSLVPDLISCIATAGCVILSNYASWRDLALIYATISTLPAFIALLCLPDDPIWLVKKGRIDEATRAAQQLHVNLDLHVDNHHNQAVGDKCDGNQTLSHTQLNTHKWQRQRENVISILIGIFLTIFSVFSGYNAIFNYALVYFRKKTYPIDVMVIFTILCALRCLVLMVLSCIIDRHGRRTLMVLSSLSMSACYAALIICPSVLPTNDSVYNTIPLFLVLTACTAYFLGMGPVTWTLAGEIFPVSMRNHGVSVMAVVYQLSTCVQLFVFPIVFNRDSESRLYIFHGTITLMATIFYISVLPETKGTALLNVGNLYKQKFKTEYKNMCPS